MRKIVSVIVVGILGISYAFAQQDIESFLVEVHPSSFQQNQPVDVTITAMKNGVPNLEYNGNVFMSITDLKPSEYSTPSKGWYIFSPEDLGKKTFSKGLEVKKSGEFTLLAADITEAIKGSANIIVSNSIGLSSLKEITILSPIASSVENQPTVILIATAPELPNSLVKIYLNGILIDQASVDSQGGITRTLTGIQPGQNTLLLSIVSLTDEELGRSQEVTFTYSLLPDQLFRGIQITPSTEIRLGDRVTFDISTQEFVSSVKINLSNGLSIPADKVTDGRFVKQLMMISTGTITVSIDAVGIVESKSYPEVLSFVVDDAPMVKNVEFKLDPLAPNNLEVSWELDGIPANAYKIVYGLDKDLLDQTIESIVPELLFTNLDTSKEYYFQITPLLGEMKEHGAPTEIYVYRPPVNWPPGEETRTGVITTNPILATCLIKGIRTTTQKIGDKYYLVWDEVPHANLYSIYMSDTPEDWQKKKLLDTTDTRYEYPFDHSVEDNVYAYFWIEATCEDGNTVEITNAHKVQVGPVEDVLMLLFLCGLIYAGIRLYRYAE